MKEEDRHKATEADNDDSAVEPGQCHKSKDVKTPGVMFHALGDR